MIDWRELALRDRTASGLSSEDGSGLIEVPAPPANPRLLIEVRYRTPRTAFLQLACTSAVAPFLIEVGVRRSVLKFQQLVAAGVVVGGVWTPLPPALTVFAQWFRVSILPTPNLPAGSVCQAQSSPTSAWPESIELHCERLYGLLASGADL